MFNFIKKLFEKEEPIEEVSVSLVNVESWLKSNVLHSDVDTDGVIKQNFERLGELALIIKKNLVVLQNAELQNKNVPVRALNLMQGNRDTYIRRTNSFIDSLDIAEPSFENAKKVLSWYKKEIEDYNKATRRGYIVMQEFFANESRNVALNIKEVDGVIAKLDEAIAKDTTRNVVYCNKLVEQISDKIKLVDDFDRIIKGMQIDRDTQLKQRESYSIKIEKLRSGDGHKRLSELEEEKENLTKEFEDHKTSLTSMFLVLEKALKKYSRGSMDERLIMDYMGDPVNALVNDPEFKIVGVLGKLKESLGGLELKDNKREKTEKVICVLNNEYLNNFVLRFNGLENNKRQIERSIRANVVLQEINELKYKMEHFDKRVKKLDEGISNTERSRERVIVGSLRDELESCMSKSSGKKVSVVLDKGIDDKDCSNDEESDVVVEDLKDESSFVN